MNYAAYCFITHYTRQLVTFESVSESTCKTLQHSRKTKNKREAVAANKQIRDGQAGENCVTGQLSVHMSPSAISGHVLILLTGRYACAAPAESVLCLVVLSLLTDYANTGDLKELVHGADFHKLNDRMSKPT